MRASEKCALYPSISPPSSADALTLHCSCYHSFPATERTQRSITSTPRAVFLISTSRQGTDGRRRMSSVTGLYRETGSSLSSPERRQARNSGVQVALSGRAMEEFLHGPDGIAARKARQRQRAEATQSGLVPERRVSPEPTAQARYVAWKEKEDSHAAWTALLAAASRQHCGEQRQLSGSRPAPGAQV
ncbi:uncharacterized protein LOC234290 isoform X1 [Mus musculus]|nr:uncharacterized protein LOC234290 isoform X1 [Mus musculus]|eukprot:XP_006509453.1 PREDICTED: uncharacterized protein LOC234290 isoform X1 [Mus musculus]